MASELFNETNPGNRFFGWLKNLFVFAVLILVVVSSFWISFQLGKRILLPVKNLEEKIEVNIPEPPPIIKPLQAAPEIIGVVPTEAKPAEPIAEPKLVETKPAPKPIKVKVAAAAGRHFYKIQAGLFTEKIKASELADKILGSGFEIYLKRVGEAWRVQVGAFKTKGEANAIQSALSGKGFKSEIVFE